MPAIKWVSLNEAAVRLQVSWSISLSNAEEIVRKVVHGGRVEVRATHGHQLIPQIVTGQIQLIEGSFWAANKPSWAANYENIEIDWRGLVVEGRKLVPNWMSVVSPTLSKASITQIKDAIRAEYDEAGSINQKPPNVREIAVLVKNRLQSDGYDASGKHIQELASAEEFKKRRRKPGATVKSDRH